MYCTVQVEAEYLVFLVVSPDTTSYSRVGYGLEDQLIFASPVLLVDANADITCPEEVTETEVTDGAIRRIVPARATGAMAMSLAAAAAARGAGMMEF